LDKRIFLAVAIITATALYLPAATIASTYGYETKIGAGRALFLERIEISGISRISEEQLESAMTLRPGDTLSAVRLEQERVRILSSHHLVRGIELSTRPGSRIGAVVLEIEISERSPWSFETGFGYHDIYGWFLTLAGVRREPVSPSGSMWRTGLRFGFHLSGLDFEWERPGLSVDGVGIGGRFYLYNQEHLFFGGAEPVPPDGDFAWGGPGWREFRQDVGRVGGELYLLYRRRGEMRLSFGLRAEAVEPDSSFRDVDRDVDRRFDDFPVFMRPDVRKTALTGFVVRIVRDTRDHVTWPRDGSFAYLSIEANNTFLGGDELFTRMELDARRYFGIGGWRSVSARMKAGITSKGTPYYDRFFIGGIHSVRGFRELSLSPASGHDGYWTASVELRVPLTGADRNPPRLTGLLFVDAGQGWLRDVPLETSTIEAALGYGFRLRLPWIGTIGLDVGIPVSNGNTGEIYRVHGSLGFSF
jgi:outer membrane protein insertion porin family